MIRQPSNALALLTLILTPHVVGAQSSPLPELGREAAVIPPALLALRAPPYWGPFGGPIIHAIDPESAQRQIELYERRRRPYIRYNEAVLPDPPNGYVLVDRVVALDQHGWRLPIEHRRPASPLRVAHLQHFGPYEVVPITTGA